MTYRPEIDGLRALAVLSVILWHAGLLAADGFLGVDVFFAISGYLITGLIKTELAGGHFSLARFYERRVRRIMPALTLVMLISAIMSLYIMLPDDLQSLGQSLIATIGFANNILLLLTSGYFELAAKFKPLMHTWSLGVEEQYYLMAPLVLTLAYRFWKTRGIVIAVAIVSVSSFAFSLWAAERYPVADFLLLTSRAWQLGCGALAFFIGTQSNRQSRFFDPWLSWLGLLLVAASLFAVSIPLIAPLRAAIAVTGACLLLIFCRADKAAGHLLAAMPLRGIGLISYSAYLIHQPVFAFARLLSLQEPSSLLMALLIPVILFLAWLSWAFVERPFRDRRAMPFKRVCLILGPALLGLLCLGAAIVATGGFYNNRPELAAGDPGFGAGQNKAHNYLPLKYLGVRFDPGSSAPKLLVIGNSFARDFINMATDSGNAGGVVISYSDFDYCPSQKPLAADLLANITHADFIVLGSGVTQERLTCVADRIAQLRARTKAKVIVLGTKNFGWNNNAIMLLAPQQRYAFRTMPLPDVTDADAQARSRFDPALYVDILAMIADGKGRVPVFTPDHKFISQDREHLTPAGAAYIGGIIFQHGALQQIARAAHGH